MRLNKLKTALALACRQPLNGLNMNGCRFRYDEHSLNVTVARPGADGRTVSLDIPDRAPTQCYELIARVRAAGGDTVERSSHGTIHALLP